SVFPSPGHSVGHQCVVVKTSAGDAVFAGDAIFQLKNMDPNMEEKWRYWVPARFVNSVEGWKSVEEIDKRSDYILPTHEKAVLEHKVYPYEGMPVRTRRKVIPGTSFYFGGI
ncbi:MAG: N-acyl homoserine lactonase family protein, partial [Deltaproteobacteria bacterium]|nr:N-acyl homoserine lactonase family protein [Deltaproteobacteria bacterium]